MRYCTPKSATTILFRTERMIINRLKTRLGNKINSETWLLSWKDKQTLETLFSWKLQNYPRKNLMTMATAIKLGNFTIDFETSELFGKLVSKSTIMSPNWKWCFRVYTNVTNFIVKFPCSKSSIQINNDVTKILFASE